MDAYCVAGWRTVDAVWRHVIVHVWNRANVILHEDSPFLQIYQQYFSFSIDINEKIECNEKYTAIANYLRHNNLWRPYRLKVVNQEETPASTGLFKVLLAGNGHSLSSVINVHL